MKIRSEEALFQEKTINYIEICSEINIYFKKH